MTGFNRYDGADPADASLSMPLDGLNAATSRLSLGEFLGYYEAFRNDASYSANRFPWAKGFALGFPLPAFQRNPVWNQEQKIRFVVSIWAGVDLRTYLVSDVWESTSPDGEAMFYREFSGALLNGQQRLTAIQEYVTSCFAVPDHEGGPRFWREVGRVEHRRFCRITFTKATIACRDEVTLRRAYDLRAFGGAAHKESERASQ